MRAIDRGKGIDGDETLRILNMTTFGALIKRGYVTIDRAHNLIFTPAGLKAYETYRNMDMPTRQKPADVTEYVQLMLGLKRQREARGKAAS